MHTVFALLCLVVVIHWLIFPYPSGLLHWHCGNLTIAPVPAKQPWWIWINTSCEFIMNDCITTTKQSTTKPCAYFLGYTVFYGIYLAYHHYTPILPTNSDQSLMPITQMRPKDNHKAPLILPRGSWRFIARVMYNIHIQSSKHEFKRTKIYQLIRPWEMWQ